MKKNKFEKYMYFLMSGFVLITVGIPVLICFVTASLNVAGIVFAGCLLLCLLAYLVHLLDDQYITGVVEDLSSLVDVLIELEEKEIFPDSEDTILSKLQSRVIKLVRILKNKNKLAEQEHEDIKELVSDISHQLKTPISNLKMYSQFLKDASLSEEKRKEYVSIICFSVDRLNFLSENMIKISRLESGLIHLNMQKQSLNDTMMKTVKEIYPKAKQKGIEITYREEEKIFISHDRNWTAEAVFNLLDNAVKYAKEGSKIILSLRLLGMFVEISVEDENGAIAEEEQAKIFTRFYRGSNSREQEGIGVGLYLSREIAAKQGGYLNLKTTDRGNIFSMMLYQKPAVSMKRD